MSDFEKYNRDLAEAIARATGGYVCPSGDGSTSAAAQIHMHLWEKEKKA